MSNSVIVQQVGNFIPPQPPNLPATGYIAGIIQWRNKVFVCGGNGTPNNCSSFDFHLNTVAAETAITSATTRVNGGCFARESTGEIFITGFYSVQTQLYRRNTDGSWTLVNNTANDAYNISSGCPTIGDSAYVHYGYSGGEQSSFWRYNMADGSKTQLTTRTSYIGFDIPLGTDGVNIYAFGGRRDVGGQTNLCDRYNVGADTWTSLTAAPAQISATVPAYYNGYFYCIGGISSGNYTGQVLRYSVSGNSWSTLAAIPSSVVIGWPGIAVYGESIYLIGGYRNGAASNKISVYHIPTNTWYYYA